MPRKFLPGSIAFTSKDALKNPRLSLGAKAMLGLMQCYDRGNFLVDPSYGQMALDLGCSKRSAMKYIGELEAAGYVTAVRRKIAARVNDTNLYQIIMQTIPEDGEVDDLLGGSAKSAPPRAKNSTVVRKTKKDNLPSEDCAKGAARKPRPPNTPDAIAWNMLERDIIPLLGGDRVSAGKLIGKWVKAGLEPSEMEALAATFTDNLVMDLPTMFKISQQRIKSVRIRLARQARNPEAVNGQSR